MRLKFAAIFITIMNFASSVHGRTNCDLHSINGFVPIKELANVLSTYAASVSIKFLLKNGQWENCSGSVVSDQGHIMTAGHCFENCAANKEIIKETNPYANYSAETKKDRPSRCIAIIDGTETAVDIKLTSECSFEEHQMTAGVKPPQKCSRFNEVAVVLPRSKLTNKFCLPITKKYSEGDRVYTIGYPSKTDRGERDSDGVSQYASFGEIIPYANKCTIIKNTWEADKHRKVNQPGDVVEFDEFLRPELKIGTIQTTVDVVPGNSGGPLINSDGEVIAVGSFGDTQKNNEYTQCKGSTFFSPIAGIGADVSHFSSDFKLSQLVCEKNKINVKN